MGAYTRTRTDGWVFNLPVYYLQPRQEIVVVESFSMQTSPLESLLMYMLSRKLSTNFPFPKTCSGTVTISLNLSYWTKPLLTAPRKWVAKHANYKGSVKGITLLNTPFSYFTLLITTFKRISCVTINFSRPDNSLYRWQQSFQVSENF